MRRSRGHSPSSPYRALAHHYAALGQHPPESASSLIRSFNVETNPTRPMRPSPLTASTIPDMPLDLVDRIRSFPLFMSAPDDFLAAIGKHLRPQIHSAHDHILTEGDNAKAMYWLVRGVVAVTSRDGEAIYAELKPGAFFGEIGVLMDVPRTATIVARTKCLLVVLKKEDLHRELPQYPDMEKAIRQEAQERLNILKKKRQERRNSEAAQSDKSGIRSREGVSAEVSAVEMGMISEGSVINTKKRKSPSPGIIEDAAVGGSALGSGYVNIRRTLKELPLFSTLPTDILHFLGLSSQPKTYLPFTDIVRQGTPGNEIYFIVSGEAEVIHETPPGTTSDSPPSSFVRPRLSQGQYFGEVASLGLSPGRTATVRSITTVECLMISGRALDELWKRCPPELRLQVEETARKRYRQEETGTEPGQAAGVDAEIEGLTSGRSVSPGSGSPSTPIRRHSVPHVTFTTPSKPSSPTKDEPTTRGPSDPDPFLSVDMENIRNRRRNSLAPPNPQQDSSSGLQSLPTFNGVNTLSTDSGGSPLKLFAFPPPSSPTLSSQLAPPSGSEDRGRSKGSQSNSRDSDAGPQNGTIELSSPFKKARRAERDSHSEVADTLSLSAMSIQLHPSDAVLASMFQHLDIAELIRLRAVCKNWKRVLATSSQLCTHVDLSPFNRTVDDWTLSNVIAPFIGMRAIEIDISNCFNITDDGFQALWQLCGKNVKIWRMKSLWHVSANQILDMSENAKRLEEVDWSNCRIIGDNLLARVVGWVVPPTSPVATNKTIAIGNSNIRNRSKQQQQQQQQGGPAPGTVIGCPNLKIMDLSYCKHVTDRSMVHLAAHASSRLQSLSLTRCTSITDAGFQSWAPYRFNNLRHLCLADCTYLSDNAIVSLVNAAKNLTHLDLSFCCALSDTATEVVALGLPMLQELRLAFCGSAVSDASLRCVALHLNDLRGLSVRGCVRVTGVGVEHVLDGCGRLEWLDASQCKNLAHWIASGSVSRWGYDERATDAGRYGDRPINTWKATSGIKTKDGGFGFDVGFGPTTVLPSMRGQRRRARKPVKFIIEKGAYDGLR